MKYFYCKKCGRIIIEWHDTCKCDVCKSEMFEVPYKYTTDGIAITALNKNKIYEDLVKSSPEFDEYLFNNRDRIKAQKSAEYERDMAISDAIRQGADVKTAFRNGGQNMPKCPTCGSLNVRHISGGERVASVGFFGIFSKKINKTFKCGNCGYTW